MARSVSRLVSWDDLGPGWNISQQVLDALPWHLVHYCPQRTNSLADLSLIFSLDSFSVSHPCLHPSSLPSAFSLCSFVPSLVTVSMQQGVGRATGDSLWLALRLAFLIQDHIWLRTTKFSGFCLAHTSKPVNYVSVAFIPWSWPWISQHPTVGYWLNEMAAAGLHHTSVRLFSSVWAEDASSPWFFSLLLKLIWEVSCYDWRGWGPWVKGWDILITSFTILLTEWIWVRPRVTDSLPLSPLRHKKGKAKAKSWKVLGGCRGGVDWEEEGRVLSSCSASGRATGLDIAPMGVWSFLPLTHSHSRIPESRCRHAHT